ncbi:MAG TPA: histidine triad nucleotide-binding protein [bacterium]|nr:histidine triad nucleotide-binding protein [bacterium]
MSDTCIFCKIARGDIPSVFLFEDDRVVAFNDINPQAPTHILVIPREHIASLNDLEADHAELVGRLMAVGTVLAKQAGLGGREKGYRFVINCGPDGGQSVDHLHLHVLGGRRFSWPPG